MINALWLILLVSTAFMPTFVAIMVSSGLPWFVVIFGVLVPNTYCFNFIDLVRVRLPEVPLVIQGISPPSAPPTAFVVLAYTLFSATTAISPGPKLVGILMLVLLAYNANAYNGNLVLYLLGYRFHRVYTDTGVALLLSKVGKTPEPSQTCLVRRIADRFFFWDEQL